MAENNILKNEYSGAYSDEAFWQKFRKTFLKFGKTSLTKLLTLYYTMQDKDTPKKAKITILGTLGYWIFPIDAVPDFIPIAGYTDDFAMLALAFFTVLSSIKDEHRQLAFNKLSQFGLTDKA